MAAKMMEPDKGQPTPTAVKGEFPACAPETPDKAWKMFVGWTTVAKREDAERLAADAVARGLAVCVQIDGPVTSHYCWAGKDLREEEFRLCFKFPAENAPALERHIHAIHPYETPEWIVVEARHVSEKYLSWAKSNPTHLTL